MLYTIWNSIKGCFRGTYKDMLKVVVCRWTWYVEKISTTQLQTPNKRQQLYIWIQVLRSEVEGVWFQRPIRPRRLARELAEEGALEFSLGLTPAIHTAWAMIMGVVRFKVDTLHWFSQWSDFSFFYEYYLTKINKYKSCRSFNVKFQLGQNVLL